MPSYTVIMLKLFSPFVFNNHIAILVTFLAALNYTSLPLHVFFWVVLTRSLPYIEDWSIVRWDSTAQTPTYESHWCHHCVACCFHPQRYWYNWRSDRKTFSLTHLQNVLAIKVHLLHLVRPRGKSHSIWPSWDVCTQYWVTTLMVSLNCLKDTRSQSQGGRNGQITCSAP